MRGVPQSGLWSEGEVASSGTGSERAKVASVAVAEAPASQGPREPALATGRTTLPAPYGTGRGSPVLTELFRRGYRGLPVYRIRIEETRDAGVPLSGSFPAGERRHEIPVAHQGVRLRLPVQREGDPRGRPGGARLPRQPGVAPCLFLS